MSRVQHGTITKYQYGCRCLDCKAAKATWHREWRQRVRGRIQPGDGDPRHGSIHGYIDYRCRCRDCRRTYSLRRSFYRDSLKLTPGYRPPADDLDPIAVERALAGQYRYLDLTRAEQFEVVRQAGDMVAAELASRLGVNERTVVRLRASLRAEADAA